MITEAEMYWLTRLDAVVVAGEVLCGVGLTMAGVGLGGLTIVKCVEREAEIPRLAWVLSFCCLAIGLVGGAGRVFVPTTKEYAAIKIIPAIANNETLRQDGTELYGLAMGWAKEKLGAKPEGGK